MMRKGLYMTPGRQRILRMLVEATGPVTARDLSTETGVSYPATVVTLRRFDELGVTQWVKAMGSNPHYLHTLTPDGRDDAVTYLEEQS